MRKRDLEIGGLYVRHRPDLKVGIKALKTQTGAYPLEIVSLDAAPKAGKAQVLVRSTVTIAEFEVACDDLKLPLDEYLAPLEAEIARIEAAEEAAALVKADLERALGMPGTVYVALPRDEIRHAWMSREAGVEFARRATGWPSVFPERIAEDIGAPWGSVRLSKDGRLWLMPEAFAAALAALEPAAALDGLRELVTA